MKRFAIAATIIAIVSGFFLKGTFGHWITVIGSGLYLGAPLALFMSLWFVIGLKRAGGIPHGLKNTFAVSAIVGVSLLLSLGTGTAIHYWEIHEARTFVTNIVPKLDEYRKEHGRYPKTIVDLDVAAPPKLLSDTNSYSADAEYFRFEYWDSAGMMEGYSFDSSTREWTYLD